MKYLLLAFLIFSQITLSSEKEISVSVVEEYKLSVAEINEHINFQDYETYEPSRKDPLLTLMRYFSAGGNRNKKALLNMVTGRHREYLECFSDEAFEIQLNGLELFKNQGVITVANRFEIKGEDALIYGLEIRLNHKDGESSIQMPFAVVKVNGYWLVAGNHYPELKNVIRKNFPFTANSYSVKKNEYTSLEIQEKVHGCKAKGTKSSFNFDSYLESE